MAQRTPNHVAIFVTDYSHFSESSLGRTLGKRARLHLPPLLLHSPRGTEQSKGEALTLQPTGGGCRVLVEFSAGSRALTPERGNRWHHVAFPSEELEADAQALELWGYRREAWAEGPDGAIATFVYLRSAGGLRLELMDPTDGMRKKYIDNQMQAAVARIAAESQGTAEPIASDAALHHIAAVLDDPESEACALHDALGIEWTQTEAEVCGGDSHDPQPSEIWASTGDPALALISRSAVPSVMSMGDSGWSHVGFAASDFPAALAGFTAIGYRPLARWVGGPREIKEGSLLAAPEGTLVLLVPQ